MRTLALKALLLALCGLGCAANPTYVYNLMEARSDDDQKEAVAKAAKLLADPYQSPQVRAAAARTLGRLHRPDAEAVTALSGVLRSPEEQPKLRAFAAWALGEMRDEHSLDALASALRKPIDPLAAQYVLEGVAKHFALLTREQERLVSVVEAMVYYAGNQRVAPPPLYTLLSEKTRTLPVNVRILKRTLEAQGQGQKKSATPEQRAATYNAAFELLAGMERNLPQITAGPSAWATQVGEAVRAAQRAYASSDSRAKVLVLWYLGKLGVSPEIAKPSAEALLGPDGSLPSRPTLSASASLRFLATWALSRLQLHAPGPRLDLDRDILARERVPAILNLLGQLSPHPGEFDLLQKILVNPTKGARPQGDRGATP